MKSCRICALVLLFFPSPAHLSAQQTSQQKARAELAGTIQAMGGKSWLGVRTMRSEIRIAQHFQGAPTENNLDVRKTFQRPDKERTDMQKQHIVQIFAGDQAWEITYKGKNKIPSEQLAPYQREKSHSFKTVLRDWYANPATLLIDQGPSQVNRHATERITLINSTNDSVTIEIDTESHLPLRLSYEWRDPRFQEKTREAIEYDNYQTIDGIATPFTLTELQNGEVTRQSYVQKVEYNIPLPKDEFDPDAVAAHLK
jgi:hypothetical protein